ncbi:hypothetical protein [Streptomyces crystallinus]|uniref:Secreted protein n=1 Tax=Streptomyces crystallinus TaxID=68191 RepID=A0ABP3QGL2_9ACTN
MDGRVSIVPKARSQVMRKITTVSVLTLSVLGLAGSAQAHAVPTAAPATPSQVNSGPPFAYADCIDAAVKQKHETPSHAKWHCDLLVQKGWVRPRTH